MPGYKPAWRRQRASQNAIVRILVIASFALDANSASALPVRALTHIYILQAPLEWSTDHWIALALGVIAVDLFVFAYQYRKQSIQDREALRNGLAALSDGVNRLSTTLTESLKQFSKSNSTPNEITPASIPEPNVVTGPIPVKEKTSLPASTLDGKSDIVADYTRSRSSRNLWREFEARYSCERFDCNNVREHAQRPTEPLRFESSSGGAYLAARSDISFLVFPSFAANPLQLRHDAAMDEVFDFPGATNSTLLRVAEPAIFMRQGQQWFLHSKGRLEE